MVAAGVPIFDVAKILGHATLLATRRDAHFAPKAGRSATDALDRKFRPPPAEGVAETTVAIQTQTPGAESGPILRHLPGGGEGLHLLPEDLDDSGAPDGAQRPCRGPVTVVSCCPASRERLASWCSPRSSKPLRRLARGDGSVRFRCSPATAPRAPPTTPRPGSTPRGQPVPCVCRTVRSRWQTPCAPRPRSRAALTR